MERYRLPRLSGSSAEAFGPSPQSDVENLPFVDRRLLALDETGQRLAVSFSDGSLLAYRLNNLKDYAVLLEKSEYNHFEGGFYNFPDNGANGACCFLYAAYAVLAPDAEEDEAAVSIVPECKLFDAQTLDLHSGIESIPHQLANYAKAPIHALSDRNGMYMSVEDRIYHVSAPDGENKGKWAPKLETSKGDVLFFRHIGAAEEAEPSAEARTGGGRLLAITENEIVLLYEETGERIDYALETELTNGVPLRDAVLSQNYLLLVGQNGISVLRWEDYKDAWTAAYPFGDTHIGARVRTEKNGRSFITDETAVRPLP